MRYYTGVGSRKTPHEEFDLLVKVGYFLAEQGWILRSGAADGADSAFEKGCDDWKLAECSLTGGSPRMNKEIFIAWEGFSNRFESEDGVYCNIPTPTKQRAQQIVSEIHPAWNLTRPDGTPVMSNGAKMLHTRNVFQVLGKTLDKPSSFLVCYAEVDKEGIPKGGTRTAWQLAKSRNIPCFNIFLPEDKARILERI